MFKRLSRPGKLPQSRTIEKVGVGKRRYLGMEEPLCLLRFPLLFGESL